MADSSLTKSPLILFAMKEEMAAFHAHSKKMGWRWKRLNKEEFRIAKGQATFDVVITGPGRLNVAEALSNRLPSSIINPGFAGSISERFSLGDLAQISSARCGLESLDAMPTRGYIPDIPNAKIVTAPAPLGAADKRIMANDQAGDLVDMETYHVLQFCLAQDIPYLGLRAVSDGVDDELPRVVMESFDGREFRLKKIIVRAIFSRSTRKQLLHLRRDSRIAAKALAQGLTTALDLLGTGQAEDGDKR